MEEQNKKYLRLLADSTTAIFKQLAQVQIQAMSLYEAKIPPQDISTVIALHSENTAGSFTMSYSKNCFLGIVSQMLGELHADITAENEDAASEICNQIFGLAKTILNKGGERLQPAIPTLILGKEHQLRPSLDGTVNSMVLKCAHGEILLQTVITCASADAPVTPTVGDKAQDSIEIFQQAFLKATQHILKSNFPKIEFQSTNVGIPCPFLADISAHIAVQAYDCSGMFCFRLQERCFLTMISEMLGEEQKEINDANQDAVAELCNQIFGFAKRKLNDEQHQLQLAVPTVIRGKRHSMGYAKNSTVRIISLETNYGQIVVELVAKLQQNSLS